MLKQYKIIIEKYLKNCFEEYEIKAQKDGDYSSVIWDAMSYTTLSGGKRLRAILTMEFARLYGMEITDALSIAASAEIMHAYSLIHDDLPGMDNDDLRRGKPSNHKIFGEGLAILAGDALIPFGAQIIMEKTPKTVSQDIVFNILKSYLKTAGAFGIIKGQVADILAENDKIPDTEKLQFIHKYKTGALFKYSILSGAKLAWVDNKTLAILADFADNFGILFQIYDDIIDCTLSTDELGKTAGKDKAENKLTYVNLYGLEEAKNIFYKIYQKNYDILKELKIKSQVLDEIYDSITNKINLNKRGSRGNC